mgnify:FL=1
MKQLCLVFLLLFFLVSHSNSQSTEEIDSTDYIQDMDSFSTSGSTSVSSGKYKTGNASAGGGTYTEEFDLQTQMSISEINSGFDLKYGVTVNSHSSNSRLGTCGSLTQRSDCRDIFKLTISLFDSNVLQQKFEHEVELDFTGNRDYSYSQTIAPNNYYSLTGEMELYGIDAGYHSGYHGPQFLDPYLTTHWEITHILNEEILNLLEHSDILDTNDFDTVDVVVESPQGEIIDTMTIEVEQNMEMAMELDTEIDIPVIEVEELPEISMEIEEMSDVEESSMERETEQTSSGQEESTSDEGPNEVGAVREAQQDDEQDGAESGTSGSKRERVVQSAKQKVASKIVKNMGDKGRYDETNQLKTLVVMQVLGNTKTFFDTQKALQDTENFFDLTTIPDNTISDSNYAQYILFGGSDAAHNALVDSQY